MRTPIARLSSVPLLAAVAWSAGCQPAAGPPAAPAAAAPAPVAPPPLVEVEPPPAPVPVEGRTISSSSDARPDSNHPLGLIDEHIHRTTASMVRDVEGRRPDVSSSASPGRPPPSTRRAGGGRVVASRVPAAVT